MDEVTNVSAGDDAVPGFLVAVIDEHAYRRDDEPVALALTALGGSADEPYAVLDESGQRVPSQVVGDPGEALGAGPSLVFLASTTPVRRERRYTVRRAAAGDPGPGIVQQQPVQHDGFRRLDTGTYTLELHLGTTGGTTASKWGMRHFLDNVEGRSLIVGYGNAIGGVFGPYFTPENGWINPPEHARATGTVLEEGPVICRYRLDIDVPRGLDRSLDGSHITIDWSFYHRSRVFDRTYRVTPYETTVDKRRAANTITVGDEFEWGPNSLVFDRFGALPTTEFRSGDPHSVVLMDEIATTLRSVPRDDPSLARYLAQLEEGIDAGSYDFFWQLFSAQNPLLDEAIRRPAVERIIDRAHEGVLDDLRAAPLRRAPVVEVNAEAEETIFPRNADKTAEINVQTGYTFVWYTTRPVRRYQIVQRHSSGWVNWGTNGENEYPELPSGTTIRSSYGRYDDWTVEAAKLESPLVVEPLGWQSR